MKKNSLVYLKKSLSDTKHFFGNSSYMYFPKVRKNLEVGQINVLVVEKFQRSMTDPNGRARFSEKSTTRYETQIKYCAEPVKFHKQPFSLQK